jgi:hypothetical protein
MEETKTHMLLECNAYNRIREQAMERHNHILKKAKINFPIKWDEHTSLGVLEDPEKRLSPKIKQKLRRNLVHTSYFIYKARNALLEKQGMFRDESDKRETRKPKTPKKNTPNIDNLKPKQSLIPTITKKKPTRQKKPYWAYGKRPLRARNTKPKNRRKELPQAVKTLISNTTTRSINTNSPSNTSGQTAIHSTSPQSPYPHTISSLHQPSPRSSSTTAPEIKTKSSQQTQQNSAIKRKRIPDSSKTTPKRARVTIPSAITSTMQTQPNTNNKRKRTAENTTNPSNKPKKTSPGQGPAPPKTQTTNTYNIRNTKSKRKREPEQTKATKRQRGKTTEKDIASYFTAPIKQ